MVIKVSVLPLNIAKLDFKPQILYLWEKFYRQVENYLTGLSSMGGGDCLPSHDATVYFVVFSGWGMFLVMVRLIWF